MPSVDGSNFLSNFLFAWLYRFLSFGSKITVNVDTMPQLPEHLKSYHEFKRMHDNFEKFEKSKREGATLIKVIFKSYYG